MKNEPERRGFPHAWLIMVLLALIGVAVLLALPGIARLPVPDNPPERAIPATFVLPVTPTARPPRAALPPSITPPPLPRFELPTSVGTLVPPTVQPTVGASAPTGPTFEVTTASLTLYQGPDRRYPVVGVVERAAMLAVTGKTVANDWWLVCCVDGQSGWITLQSDSVVAYGDLDALALYTLPELPPVATPVAVATQPLPVTVPAVPTPRSTQAVRPTATFSPSPTPDLGPRIAVNPGCATEGPPYSKVDVIGPVSVLPAHRDPELNLSLRGWVASANDAPTLWDYPGDTDPIAPRLQTLFTDRRVPNFTSLWRVRSWDWACNCPGEPIQIPQENLPDRVVTLSGFDVQPGEVILTPDRPAEGEIGGDFRAMVLFLDENSITLKYTREDNVLFGYTIQIEGVCPDPRLVALYEETNRAGRRWLPALYGRQPVGRAVGSEILLAIRDTGAFMDPRSEKDWWQGAR